MKPVSKTLHISGRTALVLAVVVAVLVPPVSPSPKFGTEEETLISQMRSQLDAVHRVLDGLQTAAKLQATDVDHTPPTEVDPVVSFERDDDPSAADTYLAQEMGEDFPEDSEVEDTHSVDMTRTERIEHAILHASGTKHSVDALAHTVDVLRAKLQTQKVPELKRRGLAFGVSKDAMDSTDDAYDSKQALIDLLLRKLEDSTYGKAASIAGDQHRGGQGLASQEEWQSQVRKEVEAAEAAAGAVVLAGERETKIAWVLGLSDDPQRSTCALMQSTAARPAGRGRKAKRCSFFAAVCDQDSFL